MKKKKNKVRINYPHLFITLIAFIILLWGIYLIICSLFTHKKIEKEEEEDKKISNYHAIITDDAEKNKSVVKKYFVDGMDEDDYINTIEKIDNYLNISGKYTKISYDFEKDYHYQELEEIYENLGKSEIVKIEVIGKSVDGRNIYAIEIGKGDDVTIFEASIHASESANTLFITKFMIDIINKYESGDKEATSLLNNHKIVVIPSANPDGYEITHFGTKYLNDSSLYINHADKEELEYIKFNANGVDLNRNFPSQTAGLYYKEYDLHESVTLKKSLSEYSYYPGDTLGSEPEVRAIMYLQNKWLPKIKNYVALHSAGQSVYNGKPFLSDEYNQNSNMCGQIVGDITGYFVLNETDEDAGKGNDGTATEYMAESLSGFIFSSETGRLSSDYYAKKYNELKYKNSCVIVIETLENYTNSLKEIKNEYYSKDLSKAYIALIER